jgi:hypothetical protein
VSLYFTFYDSIINRKTKKNFNIFSNTRDDMREMSKHGFSFSKYLYVGSEKNVTPKQIPLALCKRGIDLSF